jgi:hypothetical protein
LGDTFQQSQTYIIQTQPLDLKEFLPGFVAQGHRHKAPRQFKGVGDEFAQLIVGAAL